jgi:hypothetical protein
MANHGHSRWLNCKNEVKEKMAKPTSVDAPSSIYKDMFDCSHKMTDFIFHVTNDHIEDILKSMDVGSNSFSNFKSLEIGSQLMTRHEESKRIVQTKISITFEELK